MSIDIQVVYATVKEQCVVPVQVSRGTTIGQAIQQSGILDIFPEINLKEQKVGVYGKLKTLEDFVQMGDRIEIYRPLLIDPKDARKSRGR